MLAASQQRVANLTFGHEQVVGQQSNPGCSPQISELESDAATNQRGLIAKDYSEISSKKKYVARRLE